MEEFFLKTKITPPRIADTSLYRSRLLDLLASNIDKSMTLVCADAGFGKTTLLAQFVKKLDIPYSWYHVDSLDNDLNVFIRYLIEGTRRYIPKFGKRTLSLISKSSRQEINVEIFIGTFINELLEIPVEKILFFLDNLQEAYSSKKIISGCKFLLNHIPNNVSIIISTRSAPPFSLEHLYNQHMILEIDRDDLRFNNHEIKMLYQHITGNTPRPRELKELEAASEGWITYLQYLIQSSRHMQPRIAEHNRSLLRRLYEYFEDEIFSRLEDSLKSFLVATSVFETFPAEACNFLLSRKNSANILEGIEKKHLFISSYDELHPLYRYHHLFRDFLSDRLKKDGLYQKFQNRAGLYWEKKGVVSVALQHYFEGRNFKSAARLVKRIGYEHITTAKFEFIESCLKRLPESIINNDTTLTCLKAGISRWNCDWHAAKSDYLRAKRQALCQRNYAEAFRSLYGYLTMKASLGKHRGIISQVRKVLRSTELKSVRLRVDFLNLIGSVLASKGRIKESKKVFEEQMKLSKRINDDYFVNALHNLAVVNLELGNFAEAKEHFETLTLKLGSETSPLQIFLMINLGVVLMMQGSLEKAKQVFEESQRYAQLFNDRLKLCKSYYRLAWVNIYAGNLNDAEQLLNTAEELHIEIGYKLGLPYIWDARAELALNRGEFHEAEKCINKALSMPLPYLYRASHLITKSKVDLSLGNLSAAKKSIKESLVRLRECKHEMMRLYLQLGRFYLHKKNRSKAKNYVAKAFRLSKKNSYDFLLNYEIKFCPEITKFAEEVKIEPHYLQHLLSRQLDVEPTKIVVEPNLNDYDFVVRLFGNVEVSSNGTAIGNSAWRLRQFQEMFCFFVAHSSINLYRDKIISVFWPDHNPDTAKQLFYNALYQIRKTVGVKDIITYSGREYLLSQKYRYWIDTEEFKSLIDEGNQSINKGDLVTGLIKHERAAALYRSGFMDNYYSEWCQNKRQYYEGLHLDVLRQLSAGYYKLGNFQKALQFCKLVINKNPYNEEFCCLAMRCYANLRDLGGLKTCFSNLEKILATDLKTTPHPTTTNLFETLIKKRKS